MAGYPFQAFGAKHLLYLLGLGLNFDPTALRMAIEFAGVDQILAGSDYPHLIGSLEKMQESIRGLGLAPEDEAKIFGGNAKRILGLP